MPVDYLSRPLSKLIFRNMGEFTYKEQYGVIVLCKNEDEQKAIYERLKKKGLTLKVVSV